MYDYAIIGAGIIGTMIAREISRYQTKTIVIERENDVANVQTLANSAIIHSGHNPTPGSLKARLNIEGNRMYDDLEKELDIPLLRTGAFVIAHNQEEEKQLEELCAISRANGMLDYEILDYQTARLSEPNLAKSVTKVMSLPTTKVTYPWEVAFACMENAVKNGVEFRKNTEVTSIRYNDGVYDLAFANGETLKTKNVINAAGVDSDDIAALIEEVSPFTIHGRKGEYFVLDKRVAGFVNHVLYPLPTVSGKGVLLTPQYHGNILIGPNSEYVEDKHHTNISYAGLQYVKKNADALADNIPYNKIIRSFAGIRATADKEDFYIAESKIYPGLFHLGGIDSPGLSAAPAIAKYLLKEVIKIDRLYELNQDFYPHRHKSPEFHTLSESEKERLLRQYPTYGNIICKCELITEKEIVDAINSPLGSNTIKGIKKRTRAGAGLCQGGYCEEKIMKLIAREKQVSPLEIAYDSPESKLFSSETKVKK